MKENNYDIFSEKPIGSLNKCLENFKPGTHLSMHRFTPHPMMRCESGYYCEWVCMKHVHSWSDMRGTEQNFIQSNIKTLVRHWGNRNSKKAVHTEHAQNITHFDRPTMIGLSLAPHEHFWSICLYSFVLSTLAHCGS